MIYEKTDFFQNFVERRNPVWILVKDNLDDLKILESIKQNYLFQNYESVVLLHNKYDHNERFMTLSKRCQEQNWKFVHDREIMGSEASVVIQYDFDGRQTELYSRAKNCLIIVHR